MASHDLVSSVVDRIALRSRLLRLKTLNSMHQSRAALRRAAFYPSGPDDDEACALLEGIQNEGLYVKPDGAAILRPDAAAVIDDVITAGPAAWNWKSGRRLLESEDIYHQRPDLYRLGLEGHLLDLAENYISQPCYYMGCSLKVEAVTPSVESTRQWHRDIEDDHLFRLIIYLNDVRDGGGTFQYIPEQQGRLAQQELSYRSGYVSDERMRLVVPDSEWQSVTGPAGTLIAFDGIRIFHRVNRPTVTGRFSLTITYSSRRPRQLLRPVRLRRATRNTLLDSLTDRQRASIPAARWT